MSLPRSYQSAEATKGKDLVFKGYLATLQEMISKNCLIIAKITHADAGRRKSKRSGRDLPFIKIKCDNIKQAEALISGDQYARKTGIIFKVEEFRATPSIQQCFKCQGVGHKSPNCTKKQKCVVWQTPFLSKLSKQRKKSPKFAKLKATSCRQLQRLSCLQGSSLQATCSPKPSFLFLHLKQASPPLSSNTFNFTVDQIVSLVTNVVIQVSLLQLCIKNLPEKQVLAKSDLSKQIVETAKKCLGVNIEGKDVFEAIIPRPAPPPPTPFVFSSTLVEKTKAPLKASTVLSKVTRTPSATSSNSTKSTKTLA